MKLESETIRLPKLYNFMGNEHRKFNFSILRGLLGRCTNYSFIRKDAQLNSIWIDTDDVLGSSGEKTVLNEKPTIYSTGVKIALGINQISTPYFIHSNGLKHLRISMPPKQCQNLSETFKIEFPGNWTKTLISPESA